MVKGSLMRFAGNSDQNRKSDDGEDGRRSMSNKDFTAAISVDRTQEEAFNAINNVRGWWSENIEGNTGKLGAEFTCRYQDVHFCKIMVAELIPASKVSWHVLDNRFNFTKDRNEWTGTDIVFEISRNGNKTEIRFTHRGLVPEYECFDVCSNAWGSYINGSLRSLIATGKGNPNKKE